MLLDEQVAHHLADVVSLRYADGPVDLDMHVHQSLATHAPGAQKVHVLRAIHRHDGGADRFPFLRAKPFVDELLQRFPGEIPADLCDHHRHTNRRDGIEVAKTHQASTDAQQHHDR